MRLFFDCGTLVLADPPANLEISQLIGTCWDPRVRVYRAPALFYAQIRDELVRRGVRFSDSVRPDSGPPIEWPPPPLRPYQEEALRAWETAGRRGVIALPTGSGKTRVALAAMASTGARTLCLVPTRALLEQWRNEIAAHYIGDVGVVGDGEYRIAAITMITFESAWRHMKRLGARFDLLVVDEAHHFGNGTKDESLEMSIAGMRLGLTATPSRDAEVLKRLARVIGPTVYERGITELAGTWLSDFEILTVGLELTEAERRDYDRWMDAFSLVMGEFRVMRPGASWKEFAREASRTKDGRRALDGFRRARKLLAWTEGKRGTVAGLLERHRDSKTLVFTADNDAAYAIARENLIMPITCDIGRKERQEVLGMFRRGEIRALVSSRVLNEGLDVPDADVAIVVGSVFGEREHVQRIGRLLRPAEGKRARIYELINRRTIEVRQAQRRREGLAPRTPAEP